MVFVKEVSCCFLQVFASLLRKPEPAATHCNIKEKPSPPTDLPASVELSEAIAAALLHETHGDARQCHVAAVAGPVVAILLGAADGLAFNTRDISRVRIVLRREL